MKRPIQRSCKFQAAKELSHSLSVCPCPRPFVLDARLMLLAASAFFLACISPTLEPVCAPFHNLETGTIRIVEFESPIHPSPVAATCSIALLHGLPRFLALATCHLNIMHKTTRSSHLDLTLCVRVAQISESKNQSYFHAHQQRGSLHHSGR
jgi:hypothetical protein